MIALDLEILRLRSLIISCLLEKKYEKVLIHRSLIFVSEVEWEEVRRRLHLLYLNSKHFPYSFERL